MGPAANIELLAASRSSCHRVTGWWSRLWDRELYSLIPSYANYLLCDNNADLINLFQVLKEEGETFVKYCRDYFTPALNREEEYYRFRSEFNRTGNKKQKAALFLYLNRHGYNGLCRYNASGEFNTPVWKVCKTLLPRKRDAIFRPESPKGHLYLPGFP